MNNIYRIYDELHDSYSLPFQTVGGAKTSLGYDRRRYGWATGQTKESLDAEFYTRFRIHCFITTKATVIKKTTGGKWIEY